MMNFQVGGKDAQMQLPLYTAAAKWAHLYSPTLWIAHHLDAHRMAAVGRLETTTSFLTTLTMTSKQEADVL